MTYPTLLVEAAFTASATESGGAFLYWDDPVRGLFDTGTFAGEIWADITPYVRSLTVQRGSSRFDGPTVRYEAGRAQVVLDNRDRRFDPTNTTGPYAVSGVSQVTPMRAVRIRASYGGNLLTANQSSFEGGTTGWAAGNANTTIGTSTAFAVKGSSSLTLTRTGSAGTASATTPSGASGTAVVGGATYTWMARFRPASTPRTVRIDREWFDAAGTSLGYTNGTTFVETADSWLQIVRSAAAPAAATRVRLVLVVLSAAAGETHYVDEVGLFAGTVGSWSPQQTTYDVFRGFADEWAIEWPTKTVSRGDSVCTLRATDATKVLANFDGPAQVSQGGGEDSGARASRVLDNAGWSAADRVIAVGDTLLQATTLDSPAWDELQAAADAEGGEVYVDGAGRVTFRNRRAALTDSRSVSAQAVFGDGGDPELRYFDVTLNNDDTTLRNLVTVTRDGGVAQTVTDTDSVAQYLTRTWSASGMSMQSDADALNLAQTVLYQSKTPELRFDSITISPRRDEDVLFPEVLRRELGDRITVRRRPPYDRPADAGTYDSGTYDAGEYDSSSGDFVGYDDPIYGYDSVDVEYDGVGTALVSRDVFIRGIQHAASPQHWVTVWALQSAGLFSFMVFDDPVLGVFDFNAFSF